MLKLSFATLALSLTLGLALPVAAPSADPAPERIAALSSGGKQPCPPPPRVRAL
jgi:hypothetical protein